MSSSLNQLVTIYKVTEKEEKTIRFNLDQVRDMLRTLDLPSDCF